MKINSRLAHFDTTLEFAIRNALMDVISKIGSRNVEPCVEAVFKELTSDAYGWMWAKGGNQANEEDADRCKPE